MMNTPRFVLIIASLALPCLIYAGGPSVGFAELDSDGNGEVSLQELQAHHHAKYQEKRAKRSAQAGDKEPSADKVAARQTKRDDRQAIFTTAFNNADIDNSGGLSKAELKTLRDGHKAKKFSQLDSNGDGFVSADEMPTATKGTATAAPTVT